MVICDSGALIALLNAEDPAHARCAEALQLLPAQPLLITVPSFVEAMYFLGKLGGFALQNHLSRQERLKREGFFRRNPRFGVVHLFHNPSPCRVDFTPSEAR